MCHLILLLPLIALPIFWLWPLSLAVYALTLLISGSTYYYAMAAMRRDITAGRESLAQASGKVVSRDRAKISVRVQGELWGARSDEDLSPGDPIEVIRVSGLTLQVRRRERGQFRALPPLDRHGTNHEANQAAVADAGRSDAPLDRHYAIVILLPCCRGTHQLCSSTADMAGCRVFLGRRGRVYHKGGPRRRRPADIPSAKREA
jgi:inner membrane protein